MGWLFGSGWQTKSDLVKHLTEGNGVATLAKSVRGNVLWAVQVAKGPTGHEEKFIACYLLASDKRNCGGWGYKDMEEAMGPCNYDCPLKFFDMVPCPTHGYATEWREKVRAFHAKAAAKKEKLKGLAVGCKVRLTDGCTIMGDKVTEPLTVTCLKPLTAKLGYYDIRVKPRHIAEVLP